MDDESGRKIFWVTVFFGGLIGAQFLTAHLLRERGVPAEPRR